VTSKSFRDRLALPPSYTRPRKRAEQRRVHSAARRARRHWRILAAERVAGDVDFRRVSNRQRLPRTALSEYGPLCAEVAPGKSGEFLWLGSDGAAELHGLAARRARGPATRGGFRRRDNHSRSRRGGGRRCFYRRGRQRSEDAGHCRRARGSSVLPLTGSTARMRCVVSAIGGEEYCGCQHAVPRQHHRPTVSGTRSDQSPHKLWGRSRPFQARASPTCRASGQCFVPLCREPCWRRTIIVDSNGQGAVMCRVRCCHVWSRRVIPF